MYLQIMKTLTYLFLLLTLINLPVLLILPNIDVHNDTRTMDRIGFIFSLGKFSQTQPIADYDYLSPALDTSFRKAYETKNGKKLSETFKKRLWPDAYQGETYKPKGISIACKHEWQYIDRIDNFGIMAMFSLDNNQLNNAAELVFDLNEPFGNSPFRMGNDQFPLYLDLALKESKNIEKGTLLDSECQLGLELFKSPEIDKAVAKTVDSLCIEKNSCSFSLEEPRFGLDGKTALRDLVSDLCLERIFNR